MKKSKKIISIILAAVMALSVIPFTAMASAIPSNVNTVEKLISNGNIATVAEYLIKNINNKKADVTGTVLRLCFLFMDDEALTKQIAGRDVTTLSAEENATILVNYLDSQLPTWTAGITEQSWYGTVQSFGKILGITLDLKSVNGIIKTLYSVCNTVSAVDENALTAALRKTNYGDAAKLNKSALKNVTTGSGKNLNVIYSMLKWLSDNIEVIKIVINGNFNGGTLLGSLEDTVNNLTKDLPAKVRSAIYKLIGNDDFAASAYKDYNADELLGAAFLGLFKDNVSKTEAGQAANLSIYNILSTYVGDVYAKFCLEPLNTNLKQLLTDNLKDKNDEITAIFNWDYNFTAETFKTAFEDAKTTGILGQLNNLVCTIFNVMLSDAAKAELALKAGGNENLNDNLTKICRYVLPLLNGENIDLGEFNFSAFTKDSVQNMSLETMAVAVLKIFYPTWFSGSYDSVKDAVVNTTTLDQLGVLAAYLSVAKWLPSVDVTAFAAKATKADTLSDEECLDTIIGIGAKAAAYSLAANKEATRFEFDEEASKDWTGEAYLDEIVDWAIDFVEGVPAVVKAAGLETERGKLDGNGPFYKLNVILNAMFDFSFLTGVGNTTYALDTEKLVKEAILGNLFKLDLKAAVDIFQKNDAETNLLGSYSLINAAVKLVDGVLTSLFESTGFNPNMLGKIDDDDKISAADARLVLRRSVNLETFTAEQELRADLDNDGSITAGDARTVLRLAVNLDKLDDIIAKYFA